jgi:hypothetical protein
MILKAGSVPDSGERAVSARIPRTPAYRLHKLSGQAVVTLDGRALYLGKHGSPRSRAEYDRLVAEWLAAGRRLPPASPSDGPSDLSVNEVALACLRSADGYYVKGGRPRRHSTSATP